MQLSVRRCADDKKSLMLRLYGRNHEIRGFDVWETMYGFLGYGGGRQEWDLFAVEGGPVSWMGMSIISEFASQWHTHTFDIR